MSSAPYFNKHFNIRQVIDLLCYGTQFPHTLTSTQKITRMFRCYLRRQKSMAFNQGRGDPQVFYKNHSIARKDMMRLMELSETSAQFNQTLEEYEKKVRQSMDAHMFINQCRPYASTSGKYYVYTNEQLGFDRYGYYSGERAIGGRVLPYGQMYYPDFPVESSEWTLPPPLQFDDQVDQEDYAK